MLIRLTKTADLKILADIEISAAKKFDEYLNEAPSEDQRTLDHTILLKAHQNKSLWVGEIEGKNVGFLAATSIADSFHIEELSVMYEYQGRGLGKALINQVIKEANARQYSLISLTTDSQIPWNKPFYDRIGFVEIKANDCSSKLRDILMKEKSHNSIPENRIAMVMYLT